MYSLRLEIETILFARSRLHSSYFNALCAALSHMITPLSQNNKRVFSTSLQMSLRLFAHTTYLTGQISSILRIIRTHSVAKLSAEVLTKRGCTTFS